jgi:hypothetical protein
MTLRVRATSIAPDLRFGAAGALADPLSGLLIGDVALRAEGCLPHSPAIPCYLRYADRDAVIVADGVEGLSELESCLAEEIRDTAEGGSFDDLSEAVIVLDVVDHCFRESALWPGNIYLAGAGALAVVQDLVEDEPAHRRPEAVLRELAALELAYRFPIAGKFRSGAYDGQIQYRLNGWGRTLAARLTAGPAGAARAEAYRRKLGEHLASEFHRYSSFLNQLDVARQDYRGNRLDDALTLPIPVLV